MIERFEELLYSKPRILLGISLLVIALLLLSFLLIQLKPLLFPPCDELIEKHENRKNDGGIIVPEFIAIPERCRNK